MNTYTNLFHLYFPFLHKHGMYLYFSSGLVVKNPPAYAGYTGDVDSIPGVGRYPGEGNGNPLQYSCLGNSTDRGAWWITVHRVTKSHTKTEHAHAWGGYIIKRSA